MTTLERLDVADIERALVAFRDALVSHREAINALNVYPVPDGDTGTNMSLTLTSVVEELDGASAPAEKWKAISHGSLMGARGNSGVILSQILRALSESLAGADAIDAGAVADALSAAATSAYGAVPKPVEGTILTVIRESAEAAAEIASGGVSLVELIERTLEAGKVSLDGTPDLLPVLKDAGVVDAGGAGLLLLLDALLHVIDGRDLPPPPEVGRAVAAAPAARPDTHGGEVSVADLRYEVMFFLEAPDDQIDSFKAAWTDVGDSIVVVGGDGLWNCHIHSNDIGACIEAGIDVGRPRQIRVTDLFEEMEHVEELMHPDGEGDTTVTITNPEPATTAVVAVAVGHGVQQIFESLGVHAVIRGGQSMNPSTRQLVQAVEQVEADQVIILPNNKNIIPVAEQVDGEVDKRVLVVGTRGIAEGFASLLAYDPGADAEVNQAAMADAAEAVVAGEVTCAVREADTVAGPVAPGDWIGLDRGGVRATADTAVGAAAALLDLLITDEHELVTIIAGEDATDESNAELEAWLEKHRPDVEVEIHAGGQPLYPYYFGIE